MGGRGSARGVACGAVRGVGEASLPSPPSLHGYLLGQDKVSLPVRGKASARMAQEKLAAATHTLVRASREPVRAGSQQDRTRSSGCPEAVKHKQRPSSWVGGGLSKKGGALCQGAPASSKSPGGPEERGGSTLNPAHRGTREPRQACPMGHPWSRLSTPTPLSEEGPGPGPGEGGGDRGGREGAAKKPGPSQTPPPLTGPRPRPNPQPCSVPLLGHRSLQTVK